MLEAQGHSTLPRSWFTLTTVASGPGSMPPRAGGVVTTTEHRRHGAQARGVITLDELSPEALTEGLDLNVLFITSAVKGVSPGSPANPPVA